MSVCVATRNKLIFETRQRNEVQRNILQIHRNSRKRKIGVLTILNHQPARVNAPAVVVCQFEVPLISSSAFPSKMGAYARTIMTTSGSTRSRRRVISSITLSKEVSSVWLTNPDLRNSRTSLRHR